MIAPPPVVAIDGPAGAGKGTVAAGVAARLRWRLLDSGALYRVVGLMAARRGVDTDSAPALTALIADLDIVFDADAVRVNGVDERVAIRATRVDAHASKVAAVPDVRARLLAAQRGFRCPPGLVADGRDMGTVVFPDAALKVFLTASAEERARRRVRQRGMAPECFEAVLAATRQRDERDRNRPVAPLAPAADAVIIDTTSVGAAAVIDRICDLARERALTTD